MYHIAVIKRGNTVKFIINDLEVFEFIDDGHTYGDILTGGKVGFRQLAPLVAEYANFKVYKI
jgi:hypothetical protein